MNGPSLDFGGLHDVLSKWPDHPTPATALDSLFERTRQVLELARRVGIARTLPDLAPLLRHLLRRQSLRIGLTEQLRVPKGAPWPTAKAWARYGLSAHSESSTHILIQAMAWEPDWLQRADVPVFDRAFQQEIVRQDWTRPIDPFLAEISGFKTYVTPGQREAVRSAFLMPPGETLVICLPTGSGKSFVAQAPTLARGLEGGMTLCVVPTTALALDQARQTSRILAQRFRRPEQRTLAWHAGLSAEDKAEIKTAIREGRQGILYCSPEAVTGALLPSLYAAAKSGFLDYLVVDEVHLLSQWGDGFRPAFQLLAGVRRGLLRACPVEGFKTVLMSATLTTEAIETIDALFGPRETIQMVASMHIRPEPEYWIHREDDPEAKERKVLETVRQAPRPLILYVTKREDARRWCARLRAEGHGRVEMFHGQTPDADRHRIVDAWSNDQIDIVVATSAFGVGIDKGDVRTVLHAAVPETVDRFYQEVGRGGRDGAPSAAMLIYSDADLEVAERIAAPSLISDELGFERWDAMAANATPLDPLGLRLEINLATVPPRLRQQTEYNEAWNMRTLIMMARAGILELDAEAPDLAPQESDEDHAEFERRSSDYWSAYYMRSIVELHEAGHRNPVVFNKKIQDERHRSFSAAGQNVALLQALLDGQTEVGGLLQRLYQSYAPGRAVVVSTSCGGCSVHRREGHRALDYAEPAVFGIERILPQRVGPWIDRFPHLSTDHPIVLILPDGADASVALTVVTEAIALLNLTEVGLPRSIIASSAKTIEGLHRTAPRGMVFLQDLEEEARAPTHYPLIRATVVDTGAVPPHIFGLVRPLHLIIAPASTPDPWHPGRRFGEVGPNSLTLDQFRSGVRL